MTAGGLTVELAGARPAAASVAAQGTFRVDLEVRNGADGPRAFRADAVLAAPGRAVRFLPRSRFEVTGESARAAMGSESVNPAVPVAYRLFYDVDRLGGRAPAMVAQTLPGAGRDEPSRVIFLLRPATATMARTRASRLRRTPSRAAGTPVRVGSARTVVPPGWERADTGLGAFGARQGRGRERHFSVWVRSGRTGRGGTLVLRAVRVHGAGRRVDVDPASFFAEVKDGYDNSLEKGVEGQSTFRPGTDLGGRPAALLVAARSRGREGLEVVRVLSTGRGDTSFVVAGFGPDATLERVRSVLARVRASWSWR